MINTIGIEVGESVGVMLLSRQHRSRHPPGKIAVTVPEQTGAQPKIGRTSQNFTHPGTDGPLSGQSTSHSSGKNGPGLPSGQLAAILTMGTALGRSVSGALVGTFLGGTTGDFVGDDVSSTGDLVGNSTGSNVGPSVVGNRGFCVGILFTGCNVIATGGIFGVSGVGKLGRFVGGDPIGLIVLIGTIVGALTGRNDGFTVGFNVCGATFDVGDVLGTSTSLVTVRVKVPVSLNMEYPAITIKYCIDCTAGKVIVAPAL